MNPTGELTVQVQGKGWSQWISHITSLIRGRKDSHSPGAEGTQDLSLNHCLGHPSISKLMDARACSPDEGRVLRPRRQGPCRWTGAEEERPWGTGVHIHAGFFPPIRHFFPRTSDRTGWYPRSYFQFSVGPMVRTYTRNVPTL